MSHFFIQFSAQVSAQDPASPIRVFLLSLMLKNIEALTSINFILPCQLLISTAWRSHNQGNCASSHEYRCHNRGRSVVCIWDKQHKTLRYFLQGNPGVNYNSYVLQEGNFPGTLSQYLGIQTTCSTITKQISRNHYIDLHIFLSRFTRNIQEQPH